MILVDSNIWSELMKPDPDPAVRHWEATNAQHLWLPTVVIGELLSGAETMTDGRRKANLLAGYETIIALYADRIVPFDLAAARIYAGIVARQLRSGRNPGTADSQIAAIAISRTMKLATRNTKDFDTLGLDLIDPWRA